MLCHLTTVAQNTKVRNLTGALFKAKECVEITEDIQRKILFFPLKSTCKHKNSSKNQPSLSSYSILPLILGI